MSGESVRVAVRVRPFNQREKDRKATLIIQMQGNMTTIQNPDSKEEPKKFSFDYSYWSHDGFKEQAGGILEPLPGSNYASQQIVFNDLGQDVLDNAFKGYNCSLFAYGQTGSGKSYSMVGYGSNKGIVPITCNELFKTISCNQGGSTRYEVTFSMLEIYNEQVRDLLSKDNPKGGLQVRQNPTLGMFYVENLKKVPVGSYAEIEKRMEQGTSNRTVASTNMNATSSRAHTVVTITFVQIIKNANGSETKKSSIMNLVDLAGSERADSTGATGDRLKEGANINRSLSALGNVISALAEMSQGKKKIVVPYRDSVLTKLLQNALGGNSKTVMIAALSPADINYDETLSTLRYADRAKKIKNQAVINENPVDKLIRELREENERLKKKLSGELDVVVHAGLSPEEIAKMRRQMEEEIRAQLLANQAMLNENTQNWEEKLSAARTETDAIAQEETRDLSRRIKDPHLVNLNEDPLLSGVVFHFLEGEKTTVGRKDASPQPDITLSGLSIQKQHAVITNKKGEIEIEPASHGAKIKINGIPVAGTTTLSHKDRVLFGSNHLYVFINPVKPQAPPNTPAEITYEFAQKEIAQAKGFPTVAMQSGATLTKEQQVAQEQILEILPMVSEVNAISEELNKHKLFEVVLISAAAQEGSVKSQSNHGRTNFVPDESLATKVMVKMKNLLNGNTWLWERGKFMNRRYMMQEMYQQYLDGEDVLKRPKEEDPFWEPTEDVLIGTASVFLQSLSYALDFDDRLTITDYKGQEEGRLYVNITPCNHQGRSLDEDSFVDEPKELLGKPYHFKIYVRSAEIHKSRFCKGVLVKYKVSIVQDIEFTETKLITGTLSPEFNHSRIISIPKIGQEHLDFFDIGCITFCVYGKQEDTEGDPKLVKLTTKELRKMEQITSVNNGRRNTIFAQEQLLGGDQSHAKTELVLMHRKCERLMQKERRMVQLCEEWSKKPPEDQHFASFFRAVSAVAHSTGTRLKTRVRLLSQVMQVQKNVREKHLVSKLNLRADGEMVHEKDEGDTVSLFVFGEEESSLAAEAESNNGIIPRERVDNHHFPIDTLVLEKMHAKAVQNGAVGSVKETNGKTKDGSSTCTLM
ncbi:kinesin-like protein KIF28P isoform X3 [Pomacea canaliculata]|uniref:kinesin-like protein KIF28P isoform X3 n=1 Tax=Pomacea canaliculata TaxID=400727 RepID=UPI000D728222|nr:kinesin-like protein KIF28P isoform X3 [Pomacea canaliculata]